MKRLLLILLLFTELTFSQATLKGVVISNVKKTLAGADILLLNTDLGITTNSKGYFELNNIPEGTYNLAVSYIGYYTFYKKINFQKGEIKNLNINLNQQEEILEEVLITAKSKARKIKEQAMPVSIISMKQLSGKATNISDVIAKTIGVTLRNSGGVGSSTRISVRGLEGKRIGFFVDDFPVTDQSDFIDINDIPVDLIERIEIYKGVVPAKFGGSSMGGAVNIIIKEYPSKYADVSYTQESFNVKRLQAIFKRTLKEKGLVYGIGGGYTHALNDYSMNTTLTRGKTIKRNHNAFEKILIGGSVQLKKYWFDKIEFEPVFLSTYREIQGIETDVRFAHMKSKAYILSNALEKNDFFIEGLDFDMSTIIAHTSYGLLDNATKRYDWNGESYTSTGELGNRYTSNSDNKKFTFMHKLNLEYIFNSQNSLNINSLSTLANGYPKDDLKDFSYGKKTNFDSEMRSWIFGLAYDFKSKSNNFLNSFNTRYYHYSMNTIQSGLYGITSKDINLKKNDYGISNAMRYKFTPSIMAKFSVGYDVRIPSESELLGDGAFIVPSEDLLPERNANINTGLLYSLSGKNKSNLQIELNGFYAYLENMIRFTSSFVGARYQNFGEMRTKGLEFEIKGDISSSMYGYFNTTYQDLRDVREYEDNSTIANPTKDKRMPNIPFLLANAGVEYHKENLFGGKEQNTRIFTDASFVEEYFYDFEMSKRNKRRIPRNITFDLGAEHSFYNKKVFVSGNIKNITNREILSEFNRPLPGRTFSMKLRYIFK